MRSRDWIDDYLDKMDRRERVATIVNGLGFIIIFVAALLLTGEPV